MASTLRLRLSYARIIEFLCSGRCRAVAAYGADSRSIGIKLKKKKDLWNICSDIVEYYKTNQKGFKNADSNFSHCFQELGL
jgi:hypothetical protein